MHLKSEFRNHLVRLYEAIDFVLKRDDEGNAEKTGNLFPFIFQLYSFMWCKCPKELFKK